ncbi:MAG: nucleoside triphosphate pyrophosphohydrolase [Candidatus Limnocylindrales bacterium]
MLADVLTAVERRTGVEPADGLQVLSASALPARPIDAAWPLLILPPDGSAGGRATAALASGDFRPPLLPGRGARATDALAVLRALYPPTHPVRSLGSRADTTLAALTEADLADGSWLLPAVAPEADLASPYGLPWIVARLRATDGCPWDREQTHESLRKHLLEEAYEVYDALEAGSTPALAGELGDLLLQIVLHAQYGAEAGVFDLADVQRAIAAKIVRRHPHVFGDAQAGSVADVTRNWEAIKAAERAADGFPGEAIEGAPPGAADMPAAFAGLPRSLPALAYAQEMQDRAAALGYDWPDLEGIIDKVGEEAAELLAADGPAARAEEFGDLLLVLVNLGRRLGIDAEAAVRGANRKFARRFAHVERLAADRQVMLRDLSFDELDELWAIAKRREHEDPRPGTDSGSEDTA